MKVRKVAYAARKYGAARKLLVVEAEMWEEE